MEKNGNERNNLEEGKSNESEEKLDKLTINEPSEDLNEETKEKLNVDSIPESTETSNQADSENSVNLTNPEPAPDQPSDQAMESETAAVENPKSEEENETTISQDENAEVVDDENKEESKVVKGVSDDDVLQEEISDEKTEITDKSSDSDSIEQEEAEGKTDVSHKENGDKKTEITDKSSDTDSIEQEETEAKTDVSHEESGDKKTKITDKSSDTDSIEQEETKGKIKDNTSEKATNKGQEKKEEESAEPVSGEHDHEAEVAHLDYSNYTKKQMVQVLESLLKEDDFSQVGRILKEIKKPYDLLATAERKSAYDKYLEDGGEKDGFEYRADELDQRFNLAFNKLRDRKNQYYNSLEKQKEHNLNLKLEILEKIRELVDSEETGTHIKELKDFQVQWKEVGVIPSSQVKSLWANYNALLDRYYDQRSIYFELKELDRKKNYDLKIELCEKAEQLSEEENIREVIKHLNELHEEFKHLGPVPKDEQETVWERFKGASDKIYSRRKDYYEKLKDELKVNELAKEALVEKVIPLSNFASDRISEWNTKTKEIIAIQKEWEAIGSLPKEKAKSINKQFWTSFKSFFNKKGQFFKKIEEERRSNLKLKQELVEKAEELKDSDDYRKTSDELKKLQKHWKDIGPVPEKFRNEVFLQFKKACDHFFERRRANSGKIEKEYEENLVKKQAICEELEKMLNDDTIEIERIKSVDKEWGEIGFVPKSNIKSIQKRYSDLVGKITDKIDLPEAEKHKLRFSAQFSNVNYGPGAEKFLYKKEGALRRQISTLENDVSVWKNNLDFFASSKNADKLKEEFQVKIDKANEQLISLKEQLKIISNI